MPKFMDYHSGPRVAHGAFGDITAGANAGTADQYGVTQVELIHNLNGTVYCLLDAPDAQAVRDHHTALGVDCGDVHEVSGIR